MAQDDKVQQQVDVDACLENLDHYARAGDARSCRDIGRALALDLTAARDELDRLGSEHGTAVQWLRHAQEAGLNAIAERDRLRELAKWLVAREELLPDVTTTAAETLLAEAIHRAREALGRKEG